MSSSLIEMPPVVMNKILENFDLREIQPLRQVCQCLRNYIDGGNLQEVAIRSGNDWFQLDFSGSVYSKSFLYTLHDRGCQMIDDGKETVFEREYDIFKIFKNDLKLFLGHQNATIATLKVVGEFKEEHELVLNFLKMILESRNQRLQVKKFLITASNHSQILLILPFLDTENINGLEIRRFGTNADLLEMDEIVKVDHWKLLKNLNVFVWIKPNSMGCFTHFENGLINIVTITSEDLLLLKEAFRRPTFQKFVINYLNIEDEQTFKDSMGAGSKWYFEIPNCEDQLLIEHIIELPEIRFEKTDQLNNPPSSNNQN